MSSIDIRIVVPANVRMAVANRLLAAVADPRDIPPAKRSTIARIAADLLDDTADRSSMPACHEDIVGLDATVDRISQRVDVLVDRVTAIEDVNSGRDLVDAEVAA